MDLFRYRHHQVDHQAIRAQMTEQDPDFARVRAVHHDALQALTAKRAADGMAIRHEREFWERSGGNSK